MPQEQLSYMREWIFLFLMPYRWWWVLLGCGLPSLHLLSFCVVLFCFVLVVVFLLRVFWTSFSFFFKTLWRCLDSVLQKFALKSGLHCDSRISFCSSCPLVQTPWWEIQLCTESISCFFAHIIIMSCTYASMSAPLRCFLVRVRYYDLPYHCFFSSSSSFLNIFKTNCDVAKVVVTIQQIV